MQATWITVALRTLAKWFWPSARKSTSPVQPTITSSLPELSPATPDDADTDPKHPSTDDIPSNNPDYADGTLEELPEIGRVEGGSKITTSTNTVSEPPSGFVSAEQESPGLNSDSVDEPLSTPTEDDCEVPVKAVPPVDIDQECSQVDTGGYSEEDGKKEARCNGDDSTEQPQKLGRKPRKIGGRRGRHSPNHRSETRLQSPPSRPELICRRNRTSMTWEIILTADEGGM